MPRSRYRFGDDAYPYFMTWTIVGWLPVFTRQESTKIIYDSWRFLQLEREFHLLGYVILENHVHLIATAPNLASAVKCSKSFTALQIVELLKKRNARQLLRGLAALKLPNKKESEHQVWQEGSHPKMIETDEMLWQKLEYIHNNPVERGYVDDPLHWRYSSARNYAGQPGLIEVVTDWM
ncbi:MAG: transposase [Planctomycetota bacterium]|nr:transposase [Planctomycetota bacterium]